MTKHKFELPTSMTFLLVWEIFVIILTGTLIQAKSRGKQLSFSYIMLWIVLMTSVYKLIMVSTMKRTFEKESLRDKSLLSGQSQVYKFTAIPVVVLMVDVVFQQSFA